MRNTRSRSGVTAYPVRSAPAVLSVLALMMSAAGFQAIQETDVRSPSVVLSATQADLESALLSGEPVAFGFNGTIPLTNSILIRTNTTIDASGRQVTLDGQNRVRHFVVTNGATLRLRNLTLANGNGYSAGGTGRPGWGGAIYCVSGALELIGCTLSYNNARTDGGPAGGGAVYCADGQLVLSDCLLTGNWATVDSLGGQGGPCFGGALYSANSVMVLTGVTFSNNFAFGGVSATAYGGALAQSAATATVSRCVFVGNNARGASSGNASGGALYHDTGLMRVGQSCFRTNAAIGGEGLLRPPNTTYSGSAMGGAVMNQSGRLEITNSAVIFNQAVGGSASSSFLTPATSGPSDGGGILNRGELVLVNCTIAENNASAGSADGPNTGRGWARGGGMNGNATLVNVTMARNRVDGSSWWGTSGSSISGDAALTNCILFCLPGQTNVAGTMTDGGHNICSDASASFSSPTSYNDLDPLLGPVADNDGFPPTVGLLPRSPALNAADPTACPATDQRGVSRPMGADCDIGAYEFAPILSLTRQPDGIVILGCLFEPATTNHFLGSIDLIQWNGLGTRVADADGQSEFSEDAAQFPVRFYQVQPQAGP